MTSPETRLREALHQAGSRPVGSIDFDQLSRRHQRLAHRRWGAVGTATAAVAALAIWAGTGGSPSAGSATLVPAGPSSTPQGATQPRTPDLAAFERSGSTGPLLPGERRWGPNGRIIPAATGTPTPISRADAATIARGYASGAGKTVHVELGYFTDDSYAGVGPNGKLSTDPKHRIIVNRLIWLFSYPDAPVVSYGPRAFPKGLKAPLFVPVDATTGLALFVFQAGSEERAPGAPPD
jgi:hypothetical protein